MVAVSTFDDVLKGFKAGSSANWKAYADVLSTLDSSTYLAYTRAMGTTLKAVDPSVLKTFTNVVDDDTLVAVLRNADKEVAEALVKNMDNAALRKVAAADPKLAETLNFSVVKAPGLPDVVIRQGGTTAEAKKVSEATLSTMKNQPAINAGAQTPTADAAQNVPLSATDDAAEATAVTWVRDKMGVVKSVPDADLAEAIRNGGVIVQNSGTVRKALEKLGIIAVGSDVATFTRRHWMKMGAAMVILCMAYDTNNPFTALDRALDDMDEIVDGLKDLADSATEMAKDAAEGTFDLIAFLTKNWWMSLICCCLILLIGVAATLS